MPARQAVKLHPDDWNGLCRLVREAATDLAAKDARIADLEAAIDAILTEAANMSMTMRRRKIFENARRALGAQGGEDVL